MQFQDQEVPTPEENEVIDQPTTEVEATEVDNHSDFDEDESDYDGAEVESEEEDEDEDGDEDDALEG